MGRLSLGATREKENISPRNEGLKNKKDSL